MIAITACVDQPMIDDGNDGNDDHDVTTQPKLAANALTPTQLYNASLNPAILDTTNLAAMAASADGRAALNYVVGCALAQGHSVNVTVGGIPYQFNGAIGLADGWTSTALTASQRQWISSCTLARLNQAGVSVTISLRGSTSAYALGGSESVSYTNQEGAFFGNIFNGTAYYVASCQGSGTAPATRVCAQSGPLGTGNCGLTWVGMCNTACTLQSGYYVNCQGNTTYAETTTTYLVP